MWLRAHLSRREEAGAGRAGPGRAGERREAAGPEGGADGAGSCCGAGRSSALPQVRAGGRGPRSWGPGELAVGGSDGARQEVPCVPRLSRDSAHATATPGVPRGSRVAEAALRRRRRHQEPFPVEWLLPSGEDGASFPLRCKQININLFLPIVFLYVYIYVVYNTQRRWRKFIRP